MPFFSPFHPGQLVSCGSGLGDSITTRCLLDLLILLHLNLINSSTGPEDEKNGNSLRLFFNLHPSFVVRSDIIRSHTNTRLSRLQTHACAHCTSWRSQQNGEKRTLILRNPQRTCTLKIGRALVADAENEITVFK